jgi:lipoprotein NlpI
MESRFILEKILILLFLFFSAVLSGCTGSGFFSQKSLDGPLSVPSEYVFFPKNSKQTHFKKQENLANVLAEFSSKKHSNKEKAELLLLSGTICDELGLESLAKAMYMDAITYNPTYYAPYEVLGAYFFREGKIGDAVEALSSAECLNTEEKDPYLYLHNGIVMAYTGHTKFAYEDLQKFYADDDKDPYRLLFYYFATWNYLGEEKAHNLLLDYYKKVIHTEVEKNFGFNYVKLYLGEISEGKIFSDILKVRNNDDLFLEHLCEAYYYIGKIKLIKEQDKLAYDYFRLCENTHKYNFIEYSLSKYEMARLEKKYSKKHRVSIEELSN